MQGNSRNTHVEWPGFIFVKVSVYIKADLE